MLVQGVSGTPGAMGYFGYTYYEENSDSLKAVAIDSGSGCVEPSRRDGAGRHLHAAVAAAVHLREQRLVQRQAQVAEFVDFYIDNLADITEAAQFIPLNDEQYRRDAVGPRRSQGLTAATAEGLA